MVLLNEKGIKSTHHHLGAVRRFIDYLSSKPTIEKFTKTGLIVPARADVKLKDTGMYIRALETAQPTPVTVDYNKTLDKLKQDLEGCLFN